MSIDQVWNMWFKYASRSTEIMNESAVLLEQGDTQGYDVLMKEYDALQAKLEVLEELQRGVV